MVRMLISGLIALTAVGSPFESKAAAAEALPALGAVL
jgi:hypothetical protein